MRSLWIVCLIGLHLCMPYGRAEPLGGSYEDSIGGPADEDISLTQDFEQKGHILALRNRRNDNMDITFLPGFSKRLRSNVTGDVSYRLETYLVTDAYLTAVWFQVRQDGTRFRSYSATESSTSKYGVEIDRLLPGEYFWRVAARKSRAYDFSPEYTFSILGTISTTNPNSVPTAMPSFSSESDQPTDDEEEFGPTREAIGPSEAPTYMVMAGALTMPPAQVPSPTQAPTFVKSPSSAPTEGAVPTEAPTLEPTLSPSLGSAKPSKVPATTSDSPPLTETSIPPTGEPIPPTGEPTKSPSDAPIEVSSSISTPTVVPTSSPTQGPSENPTAVPSPRPTPVPTALPTESPTSLPTESPTSLPTESPTALPTQLPTARPTQLPTARPTQLPTARPTQSPTARPTQSPTARPTQSPTVPPTQSPTALPKPLPTPLPGPLPTLPPWPLPTLLPTPSPVRLPNVQYGLQPDCRRVDKSKFNICLDLKSQSGTYEPWMDAFGLARDCWEGIIVDDGEAPVDIRQLFPKDQVATELPPLVDDIYVSCHVVSIDGPGGILGMAGPNLVKDVDGNVKPLSGVMQFDKDDVAALSDDEWNTVIKHELAHVLGFGTLFSSNGLHTGSLTSDRYLGAGAEAEWQKICPKGRIPIETEGGEGTAGGHWDEECLRGELMTGYLSEGRAALSRLTIAAFADMGYGVNMDAADEYSIDDLGDCGNYCPGFVRRGLRPMDRFDRRKAKVSAAGHKNVLAAAAKELQERRKKAPSDLPGEITYIGGDRITVYIRDLDGQIKEETVTFDDVRDHISE